MSEKRVCIEAQTKVSANKNRRINKIDCLKSHDNHCKPILNMDKDTAELWATIEKATQIHLTIYHLRKTNREMHRDPEGHHHKPKKYLVQLEVISSIMF